MENITTPQGIIADEITIMRRKLPERPSDKRVKEAEQFINNVDKEEALIFEAIDKEIKGNEVSDELFSVYKEFKKKLVRYENERRKSESVDIVDLDKTHEVFEDLVKKAFQSAWKDKQMVQASSSQSLQSNLDRTSVVPAVVDSTTDSSGKCTMLGLEHEIDKVKGKGSHLLILCNMLSDQIEWLPESIGKLTRVTGLDLSRNHILTLPQTIGGLTSLTTLDLNSNRLEKLPDSIGDLQNLVSLLLNRNSLYNLPPTICQLTRLEELNLDSNNLSELPYDIYRCSSLQELRVGHNRLKEFPHSLGRTMSLEIVSARHNRITNLTPSVASMHKLKEFDLSFNELEELGESLCFASVLAKLDLSNNFNLKKLPRTFGSLKRLTSLDISNCQITELPDSFGLLSQLTELRVDQTPLKVPPMETALKGAQEAVRFMADWVAMREARSNEKKGLKKLFRI